jgi:hypothetical protein
MKAKKFKYWLFVLSMLFTIAVLASSCGTVKYGCEAYHKPFKKFNK